MRFSCPITNARIKTHVHLMILVFFSRQQWLRERVSVLHNVYLAPRVGYVANL